MLNTVGNSTNLIEQVRKSHAQQDTQLIGTQSSNLATQPDEFVKQENNEKKKGLSNKVKLGIAGGALSLGGIIASVFFLKGKTLSPANFAEHIDFKPAQTMEEAIEFAKKHLGIEKFNLGDDLEMANWVNEGLVKLSNRFKGKAQMPKNVILDEKYFAQNSDAAAYHYAANETIAINKSYYDSLYEKLNILIEKGKLAEEKIRNKGNITNEDLVFSVLGKEVKMPEANHFVITNPTRWLDANLQTSLAVKVHKYKQNPEQFSRFEIDDMLMQIDDLRASCNKLFKEPFNIIKKIAQQNPEFFKANCKELSYYEKLPKKEQIGECALIIDSLNSVNNRFCTIQGSYRSGSKFGTLWHEMGHLLHDMNTSLKDRLWGRLSKGAGKSFLADTEKMATSGKVSWYAQTNPDEFVAETFNALCVGKKLPDDVMKLYEYYKGPMLPNI